MIILGLGSNLGDRKNNLCTARDMLASHPDITVKRLSSIYETEPVGVTNQPAFLNAVIEIKTTLTPEALLNVCLNIERQLGRVRDKRWGPRIIDIDILFYHDYQLNTEQLSIPHPRVSERLFVLIPLHEMLGEAPLFNGATIREILPMSKDNSGVRLYCSQW